jgi:hypothetical protein
VHLISSWLTPNFLLPQFVYLSTPNPTSNAQWNKCERWIYHWSIQKVRTTCKFWTLNFTSNTKYNGYKIKMHSKGAKISIFILGEWKWGIGECFEFLKEWRWKWKNYLKGCEKLYDVYLLCGDKIKCNLHMCSIYFKKKLTLIGLDPLYTTKNEHSHSWFILPLAMGGTTWASQLVKSNLHI